MYTIPCIIFAGGKSSRMGQDKSLLPFGDYPTLAEFQYRRLQTLFERVCISAKEADKFDFNADVIPDIVETGIYAPTAGFVSVFQHLNEERIFVLSVDTPFVGEDEIAQLIDADGEELDAVIARSASGSHPMCGIYHRSLLPAFVRMVQEDDHRLDKLLKKSHTRYVEFSDEEAFTNLNHPDEYQRALEKSR